MFRMSFFVQRRFAVAAAAAAAKPLSSSGASSTSTSAATSCAISDSHSVARCAPAADVESQDRLNEFRKFYETVSRTRELAPTRLGHAGSERILNNNLLHRSPWQASCIELRERVGEAPGEHRVLSYDRIDFSALRRRGASGSGRYTHVEQQNGDEGDGDVAPAALDVVHYYETSGAAGLAGYQSIAMMVRKGLLPGRTENYSAEGGFGVWVVPHADYVALLVRQGRLEA